MAQPECCTNCTTLPSFAFTATVMSERIEVFHPILAAKLEKDAFEVAGWGVLSAVLFGVFSIWFFAIGDRMPKLPIAMQEEVPNRKKRIDIFIKDTRTLLIDSYKKV